MENGTSPVYSAGAAPQALALRQGPAAAAREALLAARERPAFVSAVRALDRVLLSGFYVVPLFYLPVQWIASSDRVAHPKTISKAGFLPETWYRRVPVESRP